MSLWIPNFFNGIRVKRFSADWTHATVEMHVNVFTRNSVKTGFGGSMSAMTDPYFFMLLMHQLGRDYVVWDTRGEIEFLKPGRGVVWTEFRLDDATLDEVKAATANGDKYLHWFENDVLDAQGEVVARVRKQVYVRLKPEARKPD